MATLAPSHSHSTRVDFKPPSLPTITSTNSHLSNNLSIRNSYAKLQKVGEGTYASVFLAKHIPTGRKVAIKKIKVVSSKDGMDVTAIREVKFLREFNHCNVIAVSNNTRSRISRHSSRMERERSLVTLQGRDSETRQGSTDRERILHLFIDSIHLSLSVDLKFYYLLINSWLSSL